MLFSCHPTSGFNLNVESMYQCLLGRPSSTTAEHANCECDRDISATDAITSDLRQRSLADPSQSQSQCEIFMQRAPDALLYGIS